MLTRRLLPRPRTVSKSRQTSFETSFRVVVDLLTMSTYTVPLSKISPAQMRRSMNRIHANKTLHFLSVVNRLDKPSHDPHQCACVRALRVRACVIRSLGDDAATLDGCTRCCLICLLHCAKNSIAVADTHTSQHRVSISK